MRVVTIILSVYFLALNFVPCSDAANVSDDPQIASVVDGDHDQDCELCSPFCQCHCCHVHTIDFGFTNFEPFNPQIIQNTFAHFDSVGKDISLSLLQPPRV